MLAHYGSLVASAAADPDQSISRLGLLEEFERRQLLIDWNDTKQAYSNGFVHQFFEDQAEKSPHEIAIVCGTQEIAYGELNRRANQIAHRLISSGIRTNMRVGICMHRSVEMVAAMLAILKAGATYVPLDPDYPQERLRFMTEDAGMALVLTTDLVRVRLPKDVAVLSIDAADIQALLSSAPAENLRLDPPLRIEDPAYVIYTSGSTGTPKGVIIRHKEFTNYISWACALYESDRGQGAPINTSFGFDATITSLYVPLVSGKRVILLPEDRQLEALADLLASGIELTLVKLTPAHLEALRSLLGSKASAIRARAFVVGGEAFTRHLADFWHQHCPATRIFNEYGPTETVVGCCVYMVGSDPELKSDVPIGRPTPNTRLYVLDVMKDLVPIGVVGELHIGGSQVGAGYLNRPELTAERFLPDPFAVEPDGRMYRTGDLARWRADGVLEFLGRADDQVKIRGFRVELGEIETTLAQHSDVQSAAVAVRDMPSGEKQLVAYCVPKHGSPVDFSSVRQFLVERLPDHMVPRSFVSLTTIPLTSNGKVDRRALPAPPLPSPEADADFALPRTPEEARITMVWADVLSLPKVGTHDNFFEIGGTSLLAVRILSRLRSVFRVELPLSALLAAPTIEQLARFIQEAESAAAPQSCIVPIQPRGSRPPLFCVHGIGGNVLSYYALAKNLGSDQPVYGLQARGLDGKSEPFYSLPEMGAHYISEIRSIQPEGPYYLAGLSLGGLITLEIAQQLSDAGQEVALIAMFDTFPPGMAAVPGTDGWRRRLRTTTRRIQLHSTNLWRSGGRELIPYVRARLKTIRRRAKSRALQVQYELAQKFDGAIPQAFRNVEEAGAAAAKKYVARQYNGPAVYFQAENSPVFSTDERRAMWFRYIPGLMVETISSDHLTILDEPSVRVVAEKLKMRLDQASRVRSMSATASR
jgi:amino acid adenylation domain-containing protein